MKVRVKTQGFRELAAALSQELPKATRRNVLVRVGKAAMQPIADDMAERAPVQAGGDETLKHSIAVSTKLGRRQKRLSPKQSTVEIYAGPGGEASKGAPPQGVQQEFGNENHGPQAFVRPAWDGGKDDLLPAVADGLVPEIEKAKERIRRKAMRAAKKAGRTA